MRCTALFAVAVFLFSIVLAGCEEPAAREAESPAAAAAAPEGATPPAKSRPADLLPARFEATIYEVRMSADRAGELDAGALAAKAPKAEGFAQALAALGPTKTMYTVDQVVNLYRDNIRIGTREPMITNTRKTDSGQTISTVQYQQVGAVFQISGGPPPKDSKRKGIDASVKIELSTLSDTGVHVATEVTAPAIRSISLTHNGPVEYGRPFVILSVNSTSKDAAGNAVAYVCRGVFTEVAPPK